MVSRPLRIALLTNPGSGRNRKGLERVRRFVRNCPGLVHREAANPAEISEALAELNAQEPDLLAVNGGDVAISGDMGLAVTSTATISKLIPSGAYWMVLCSFP